MILFDTSAWIHYLNKGGLAEHALLQVVTCPPIIQEVLQGIRSPHAHQKVLAGLCALPQIESPVSLDVYLEAADIYRFGRKKGYTIRASTDCLIAAIAIRQSIAIHHFDRDFEHIAQFTKLEVFRGYVER